MSYTNKTTLNFAGGEVDPNLVAREDIPLYAKAFGRIENFIVEPQGPVRFRNGTTHVNHTRLNNPAMFIEFQFSDVQSYLIEVTEGYMRFIKDGAYVLESTESAVFSFHLTATTIRITAFAHGFVDGQEIFLQGMDGATELNGRFFIVELVDGDNIKLLDVFGDYISPDGLTTYVSGGVMSAVYEIKSPYLQEHIENLKYAQNFDEMRITSSSYEPRLLTRIDHDDWTLELFTRTADPFSVSDSTPGVGTFDAISAINVGTDVLTYGASTPLRDGDHVYITGVVGSTELNDKHFTIDSQVGATSKLLDYATGDPIDIINAWTSGGYVEIIDAGTYPAAIGFTDGARLSYGGTDNEPEALWYSRGPTVTTGENRFDDFTQGTSATHSMKFTLAPIQGKNDAIRWLTSTDKYQAVGTFGSIRRVFGASEGVSISVDEITARSANSDGVSPASPVVDGAALFYIGRSGLSLESLEYDYQIDGYNPEDRNIVSAHLTAGGLKQVRRQVGRPTMLWVVRNDGALLALTYKGKENIAAWHRHYIAGGGLVEWIGMLPQENNEDQLWMIVKRTINEQTVRYVEYLTFPPVFPDILDFYTGGDSRVDEAVDRERFNNYQNEALKYAIHLDSCLVYDGAAYGVAAQATITMGEGADVLNSEDITVTASADVFTESMVGREIWGGHTSEGIGGGRLLVTGFTSETVITGTVTDEFPATATYEPGVWYVTQITFLGLQHLETMTVGVVADGGEEADAVVEDGTITISEQSSVVHIGLKYQGIIKSLPLDQGGISGGAQNKLKVIAKVITRFINSAGAKFGSSLYRLKSITFRRGDDYTNQAAPLFTGAEETTYQDRYELDKSIFYVQTKPLPCTIASVDVFAETSEE
jgi:hypothetical protein